MKKIWKPLLLSGIAAAVLVGCSDEKELTPGATDSKTGQETTDSAQGVDYKKLYTMKDKEVLVEVEGKKLTVGEVKEKLFQQGLTGAVNQFIDSTVLINAYKITDEDVEKEIKKQKESMGEYAKNHDFDKEAIRYNLAYEIAIKEDVEYTEKDLKDIYEQYYAEYETRSFEEMKDQLKEQAPYVLGGNNVYEKQQELKKDVKVKFGDKTLEAEFERMMNPAAPVKEATDTTTKENKE
jgi:hypothetical protein